MSSSDHGGVTTITAVHPDIIQSHILNRLDGPTLAATSCVSAQLLSMCSDDQLWKDICSSIWPSTADRRVHAAISNFPSGHRSFYSDAFPSPSIQSTETSRLRRDFRDTPEIISAVDIYCDDKLIYSKVLVTETISTWFLCTPLRLDLLDPKETVATPLQIDGGCECLSRAEERLRVSWILIDPVRRRAINVASRRAVVAHRHWLTGDIQLRFAIVTAAVGGGGGGGELVECAVVVSCWGSEDGEVRVREVSMQVEDTEGKILMGKDSLGILQADMAEQRMRSDVGTEKDNYETFSRMKAQGRERKQRREKGLDTLCIVTGISILLTFFMLLTF